MQRIVRKKYLILALLCELLIVNLFHLPNFASEIFDSDKNIIGKEYEIGTVINSDEKMKWFVMDYDKSNPSKFFLVTKDIVDFREFHYQTVSIKTNYKNSKIRYYLNKEFYEKNFSIEEKQYILLSEIQVNLELNSTVNEESVTEQIKVNDKIFLLSVDELAKYKSIKDKITRNSYAEKIAPHDKDFNVWTRDIKDNYSKAIMFDAGEIKGADPYTYRGVIAGMWYDLSSKESKEDFAKKDEDLLKTFLLERKGGKDKIVSYTDEERSKAVKFDNKELTKYKYNVTPLGIYTYNKGSTKPLTWYVVNDDGKEITLLSKNIMEYMEIEYDTYDKDELNDDPYSHSNLKKYINGDLYDNIFNDDEKKLIISKDDEKMTLPNANDIFNYDLLSDWQNDMVLNTYNQTLYGNSHKLSYFVNIPYKYNGVPYIMSLMEKDGMGRVSFNFEYNKDNTSQILTCSGIRPVVKVDKKKYIEYLKNKSIDLNNENLQKESSINKKIKFNQLVRFGKYEQDDNLSNGKESIEWRVIRKKNDKYLLISDKVLDVIDLTNDMHVDFFEKSFAYNFANAEFFDEAFSEDYKKKLEIINSDYVVFDRYRFVMAEDLYADTYSSQDFKYCFNKVGFLSARFDVDNINLVSEEIFKPKNTKYVNNKINNLDTYLVEDLAVFNGINYYIQLKNDGSLDYDKKMNAGFRPVICIDRENLVKIIENKNNEKY